MGMIFRSLVYASKLGFFEDFFDRGGYYLRKSGLIVEFKLHGGPLRLSFTNCFFTTIGTIDTIENTIGDSTMD
jgi:hypothetical protein